MRESQEGRERTERVDATTVRSGTKEGTTDDGTKNDEMKLKEGGGKQQSERIHE